MRMTAVAAARLAGLQAMRHDRAANEAAPKRQE
jgi:hypothetical protein